MKFGIPMVRREPTNHLNDCYFCMTNIYGINKSNRSKWNYPDLASARRPVPHSDEVPIPVFKKLPELPEDEENHKICLPEVPFDADNDSDYEGSSSYPKRFNQ